MAWLVVWTSILRLRDGRPPLSIFVSSPPVVALRHPFERAGRDRSARSFFGPRLTRMTKTCPAQATQQSDAVELHLLARH
jgi:hypothetical protein